MGDNTEKSSQAAGAVRTMTTDGIADAGAARIGDRELWIANANAVAPETLAALNLNPEYVVSVNREAAEVTTDHYPLRDGYINPYDEFTAAVDATRDRIQAGGTVVVNCAAGISRSATVIATALAVEEDRPFDDVVEEIRETREYANPNVKLALTAGRYLVDREGRPVELQTTDTRRIGDAVDEIRDNRNLTDEEKERFEAIVDAVDGIH